MSTNSTAVPALESVVSGLGDISRWRILSELSAGEPLMVIELAERIGRSSDATSKHLAVLRKAGLVVSGRGQLYQIPKQYLPTPGQRIIDYGCCLLRLDSAKLTTF
jgi:DNA-binding transcriptional ArsR family regulator